MCIRDRNWGDTVVLSFFRTCLENEKYGVFDKLHASILTRVGEINGWLIARISSCFQAADLNKEFGKTNVEILDSLYYGTNIVL